MKYSKKQQLKHCIQFMQFLEANNLTATEISREKLRHIFMRDYKPERKIHVPSFSHVFFTLRRFKLIKLEDGEDLVHFTGRSSNSISNKKPLSAGNISAINAVTSGSIPAVLSVDQFVALQQKPHQIISISASEPRVPFLCSLCNVTTKDEPQWSEHIKSASHELSFIKRMFQLKKPDLIANKNGIEILAENAKNIWDEGKILLNVEEKEVKRVMITIKNQNDFYVELQKASLLYNQRVCTLDDPMGVTLDYGTARITAGNSYDILVTFQSNQVGTYVIPIAFLLRLEKRTTVFHVIRYLVVTVSTTAMNKLAPNENFHTLPRASLPPTIKAIIKGLPLPMAESDRLERILSLANYTIPQWLRHLVNHGIKLYPGISLTQQAQLKKLKQLLTSPPTLESYSILFGVLLFIEELQLEVDLRRYDLKDVMMKRDNINGHLLILEIPGLTDKRPSLLKGDTLYVTIRDVPYITEKIEYQGVVHEIKDKTARLGFDRSFLLVYRCGMRFDIRFSFNRLPLQLEHRALELIKTGKLEKFLFPDRSFSSDVSIPLEMIVPFNPLIVKSEEQLDAVRNILRSSCRPGPYLVFGPPGTGKTVTLVEAMKQVWKLLPHSHILVCAPSNTAVDLITKHLLDDVPHSEILRIHAHSRDWTSVAEKVRVCSNYDPVKEVYFYPEKKELMSKRFLITTLITAGKLVTAKFPRNHFTHLFIDEAGQATEPETLVALAGNFTTEQGFVVLAGDPYQLGPVLRSPISIEYGLGISLLERLLRLYCNNQMIDFDMVNCATVSKLFKNYRSHPSILEVPNRLFYNGKLQGCVESCSVWSMSQWDFLPKSGFPLIFHGANGREEREGRDPSFFNTAEAKLVCGYVQSLLIPLNDRISPQDVGIVTPYHKQAQKIRMFLEQILTGVESKSIAIGPVEKFQGKERRIIIISTVRSNPELLTSDDSFQLGFLKNAKRMNVAVTRSKELLIVVGNPYILQLDPHWNQLLEYCRENGAYLGCYYEPKDIMAKHILRRFAELKMENKESHSSNICVRANRLDTSSEWKWQQAI